MANFKDGKTVESGYESLNSFSTRMDSRTSTRSGADGMLGLVSDGMGVNPFTEQVIYGTDLVGMNAPNAKKAADNMVERLNKTMKLIDNLNVSQTTLDAAVKSQEVQTALKNYIEKEKSLLKALVSDLKGFCDKLYQIAGAWEKSTDAFGQKTISGAATSNFSDVSSQYTTKFTSAK